MLIQFCSITLSVAKSIMKPIRFSFEVALQKINVNIQLSSGKYVKVNANLAG